MDPLTVALSFEWHAVWLLGKPWSVFLCLCVHYSSTCICAYVVYMCLSKCKCRGKKKKCMCGHCYVIHGTSCILERHCGLQGERADPLHHHYHYHHQSSFEWRSWTRPCTEPLAWPHLDITFEMGKMMEGEKGLKERMKETGRHRAKECGWEENTPGRKAMLKNYKKRQ